MSRSRASVKVRVELRVKPYIYMFMIRIVSPVAQKATKLGGTHDRGWQPCLN